MSDMQLQVDEFIRRLDFGWKFRSTTNRMDLSIAEVDYKEKVVKLVMMGSFNNSRMPVQFSFLFEDITWFDNREESFTIKINNPNIVKWDCVWQDYRLMVNTESTTAGLQSQIDDLTSRLDRVETAIWNLQGQPTQY